MTSTETEPDVCREDLSTPSSSLLDESPDPLGKCEFGQSKNSDRLTQDCRIYSFSQTDLSASASTMPAKRGQARAGSKKQQTCAKCKAHGIKSKNQGHKNHCPLKTCLCADCAKVDKRREKMKLDIQKKRDQRIKELRIQQGLPVNPVVLLPEVEIRE